MAPRFASVEVKFSALQPGAGATKVAFETGNAIVIRSQSTDQHDQCIDPNVSIIVPSHSDICICKSEEYVSKFAREALTNGYSD